jgi:hypothetical protein
VAFPEDPLGVRVRLQLGGEWVDITPDVQLPIRIARGRRDAAAQVSAGSCALTLLNPDGRYSPGNPLGQWFGLLGRNTGVEVSVRTDSRWLDIAADSDTTATAGSAVDITGDLDVRVDVACARWSDPAGEIELAGRYDPFTEVSGWALVVGESGSLAFGWGSAGVGFAIIGSGDAVVPAGPGDRITVRVTVEIGSAGSTVTFWTGPSVDGPWTQLGDAQPGPPYAVGNPSAVPLAIGDLRAFDAVGSHRQVYALQVRDGVDGTVVAAPDFTAQPLDTTEFTDSAGVPWDLSTPIGRRVRFRGVVPSWPAVARPRARTRVPVQAAGPLRRLNQAPASTASTLFKAIRGHAATIAYWPMEDGQDAVQAYSPLPLVQPMQAVALAFAADDSLAGSAALPTLQSGALLRASVPQSTTGQWRVEFVYRMPDGVVPSAGGTSEFLEFRTSTARWWVTIGTTSVTLNVDSGGTVHQFTDGNAVPLGEWARFYVQASQAGGDVAFEFGSLPVGGEATTYADSYAGTVGRVQTVGADYPFELVGMTVGHLAVFDAINADAFRGADTAYASFNEDAMSRAARVAAEAGIPLRLPWPSTIGVELVGPQETGKELDLCRSLADLDMGILYEGRHVPELVFRPRYTLINQPAAVTLTYGSGSGIAEMTPVPDDEATRNTIAVQRAGGTSAVAVLVEGPLSVGQVGEYPASVVLNLRSDSQVDPQAWWRLHLGTYAGARYPVVRLLLHEAPAVIPAVAALDTGDRIRVDDMPVWEEPDGADLLVQGYAEVLGARTWEIEFNCSPYGPWVVGVVGDDVLGRADTDGSELAADIAADDTTLSVEVTAGPLWTTDPAQYPFSVRIGGGEVAIATACTGTSSPQTMTVFRAVNGVRRGWPAGADVRLANPMIVSM